MKLKNYDEKLFAAEHMPMWANPALLRISSMK
jgi:hypothetical protein